MPFDACPDNWDEKPERTPEEPETEGFFLQIFLATCVILAMLPFALMIASPLRLLP